MAATTKLIVWNNALREIATAPLADTTTANTRQFELNAAWDHCIEHTLAQKDWGFARRRSALTGISDTSFSPYTYRFAKPSDYLRKCWLKTTADDEFQVDHAEIAAVFYSMEETALLEYVSDHADNYDPANWPPHFTRALTLYLASLVAPKLARAGAEDLGRLNGQFQNALDAADAFESVFLTNTAIPAARQPVMRRALELMGQQLAGSVPVHAHTDMLRWHMNRTWDHAIKYVLELGAWNFATQRALLAGGIDAATIVPSGSGGIIEGMSIDGSGGSDIDTPLVEYDYGFAFPDDYLHKIWLKVDPNHEFECDHQIIGNYFFTKNDPVALEYIALNDATTSPANWSANFLDTVASFLALSVVPALLVTADGKNGPKINANEIRGRLEAQFQMKLSDAKLRDAMQQVPKKIATGRFARARLGSIGTNRFRTLT